MPIPRSERQSINRLRFASLPADRFEELVGLYEHLHRIPELAFQEFETVAALVTRLPRLGPSVQTGIGGIGIVGILHNGSGPVIVLRADIDALPVRGEIGLAYASTARANGSDCVEMAVMHACRHDIHMVSMLGTVEVLTTNRAEWAGTLVMLFHPAEEIGKGAGR
jgi:metal-dependent amidase/aminoacylase/carboxypeptidase family protein